MALLHAVQETYRLSSPLLLANDSLSVSHSHFCSPFLSLSLLQTQKRSCDGVQSMMLYRRKTYTASSTTTPPPSPSLPAFHDTLKSIRPFPKERIYGQFPLLILYPYTIPLAFSYPSIPSISQSPVVTANQIPTVPRQTGIPIGWGCSRLQFYQE